MHNLDSSVTFNETVLSKPGLELELFLSFLPGSLIIDYGAHATEKLAK